MVGAKRVLVTGGSGFIGSAIIKAFQDQRPAYDLVVLDVQPLKAKILQKSTVRYFHADITNEHEVSKAIGAARPDVIVHVAGYVPSGNSRYNQAERDYTFKVNVHGTENVLAAARQFGVQSLVYTSSCTAITDHSAHDYPNMTEALPVGSATLIYGESKGISERLVLAANSTHLKTCALRPSTVFGAGDTQLIPTIHQCIAKGETPFIVGTGLNLYDFSFVSNIADAHVLAVGNLLDGPGTAAGEAFFVSNGQPVPFRAFCLAVWAQFGHYPPFEVRLPWGLAYFAGFVAEIGTFVTGRPATLSRGSVKDACQTAYASIEKARTVLGYEPRVSIVHGLREACMDYKQRLEICNKKACLRTVHQ
ncbi:putative NAD dependent epimerase/dehydratase [Pseudovirgaria hyperparasitica]|uniref:Putative NAD dependent epimerase/dehydratase n=1 Tax=Pseudovirgaria hyperparasitica TaxID=470096 RepID=A0A6A6W9Q8_9PEZI|nr:putative NAD dependent epimerase/dehydratase [Pseudovirgaria hyperparasitica]KAF2759295.1 putative NAD dependent epimerase/dehydratase [Pseudovirgaria hyperparasitica]